MLSHSPFILLLSFSNFLEWPFVLQMLECRSNMDKGTDTRGKIAFLFIFIYFFRSAAAADGFCLSVLSVVGTTSTV